MSFNALNPIFFLFLLLVLLLLPLLTFFFILTLHPSCSTQPPPFPPPLPPTTKTNPFFISIFLFHFFSRPYLLLLPLFPPPSGKNTAEHLFCFFSLLLPLTLLYLLSSPLQPIQHP